jgi:hypothetical protein
MRHYGNNAWGKRREQQMLPLTKPRTENILIKDERRSIFSAAWDSQGCL